MTSSGNGPARRLKILLLYDRIYPESLGGVEHRNRELARALLARGHHVTLAGFCTDTASEHPDLEILSFGPPQETYNTAQRSSRAAARLAAACGRLDLEAYDLVECANIPYAHLPPLAARCRWSGKPLMVTWYEFWGRHWREYIGPVRWLPYAGFEWLCGQLGQRAVAVSGLTEKRLERCRKSGVVDLVPCGLDLGKVRGAARSGAVGDPPHGAPPLIYAGRLLAEKRVDLLLRAVERVTFSTEGPLLTVIGEGSQRQELRDLAETLGIAERVRFLGYLETNEDVWAAMQGARIAVQPSSREGFGLFPLEAMALGLPVVYCESSENAVMELVHHGTHGICSAAEPEALARALDDLLADPDECRRLGANGARHAESFDWQDVAARFERLAETMIRERSRVREDPRR